MTYRDAIRIKKKLFPPFFVSSFTNTSLIWLMENLIFRIKHIYLQPHQPNMYIYEYTYRMFNKNCIFVNSLQPIPCMEIEQLILAKDLSTHHSYWLVIFCTTNSSPVLLAREKPQNFKNYKNPPPQYF